MLWLKKGGLQTLGVILLSCLSATPSLAKLSPEQINAVARQTTVLLAPGLTPELVRELENNRNNPLANNSERAWNPGSGVIIAKQGKTYYVLTVAHNFGKRFVDANTPYGIRTWDREVHLVTKVNDGKGCPLSGSGVPAAVVRFGCRISDRDVRGFDVAIVSFESDKPYPIAPLGDANSVNIGDTVYVSGWPDPEREAIGTDENGEPICGNVKIPRRQRRLAWGPVKGKLSPGTDNLGYSIFYTDNTRVGMSGGPVFDSDGRVVGSHGMGRRGKSKCGGDLQIKAGSVFESADDSLSNPVNLDFNGLTQRYSSSQQVNFAVNLLRQAGLNLPFSLDPPSAEMISNGMKRGGIQAIAESSGRIEFDASADGFEDPEDAIDDIYKVFSFSLDNQRRVCPSGGSGSLLLDDEPCF